ncbi:hypothetical protein ANTRET_LOCUS5609, partial [Anthophora retusa]
MRNSTYNDFSMPPSSEVTLRFPCEIFIILLLKNLQCYFLFYMSVEIHSSSFHVLKSPYSYSKITRNVARFKKSSRSDPAAREKALRRGQIVREMGKFARMPSRKIHGSSMEYLIAGSC